MFESLIKAVLTDIAKRHNGQEKHVFVSVRFPCVALALALAFGDNSCTVGVDSSLGAREWCVKVEVLGKQEGYGVTNTLRVSPNTTLSLVDIRFAPELPPSPDPGPTPANSPCTIPPFLLDDTV